MKPIEFKSYLIAGQFFGFSKKTTESDLIEELGDPLEIEDYGTSGKFFHYKNFRLAINRNVLEYVDVFFINTDAEFEMDLDDEILKVNKSTSLLEILHLLNSLGVQWKIISENSRFDYLNIELNNGLQISYYYGNGYLERITSFLK